MATKFGGGIFTGQFSDFIFSDNNRSSVYNNNTGFRGRDIYSSFSSISEVIVDTFTVHDPGEYFIFVEDTLSYDIQSSYITQVEADLFISPIGDNNNSGLSAASPLKSISYALAKIKPTSDNPCTINLSEGTYSSSDTGEMFPLNMKSNVTIEGYSEQYVIIDAELDDIVLAFVNDLNCSLSKLTLCNGSAPLRGGGIYGRYSQFDLSEIDIKNNRAPEGGGLYTYDSQIGMNKVKFRNNSATYTGGAIYCCVSQFDISELLITNNNADTSGGGIFAWQNDMNLVNTTFAENTANYGGAIYIVDESNFTTVNSIFWENSSPAVYLSEFDSYNIFTIQNSNLQGGEEEILVNNNTVNWLDNNLNTDPLFDTSGELEYELSANSPCLDAGTNFFEWNDSTIVDLEAEQYAGLAPDMGYAEYGMSILPDYTTVNPLYSKLFSNYPNPFNPNTTIMFSIPKNSNVELFVYNIKGQKIKTLVSNSLNKGSHQVVWHGKNDQDKIVGSGVYFYQLITDSEIVSTKKCILMK